MKLKAVWHYDIEDNEDCYGDYYGIELFRIRCDGKETLLATFGDWYHEKGAEQLEGFIKGIDCGFNQAMIKEIIHVETVRVFDGKCLSTVWS